METLQSLPDWFGTALIGAIFAALGYFAKLFIDGWKEKHRQADEQKTNLQKISSLLQESKSLFRSQNELAKRLLHKIKEKQYGDLQKGYENNFYHFYDHLDKEEKDLHSIIRGITSSSMHRVNMDMKSWLEKDLIFRTNAGKLGNSQEVSKYLKDLEIHLNLWLSKFDVWMSDKKHALVYMGDESRHGKKFPIGIEGVIDQAIASFNQD